MTPSDQEAIAARAGYASDRALVIVVFVLLAAVSFLPVVMTPIPAMVDYPNHLARMSILSRDGTPDANPYYEVVWAIDPNLAMDLLVPRMAGLFGVETATRMFLLMSQLLIVGGAVVLEWVVKRRIAFAGFVALMFLYCLPFAWGFINFEFGLGVALFGISSYLMVVERTLPVRLIVNTAFVALLFVAHFFALGIYGVTLGLYEIWRSYERKLSYPDSAMRLLTLAAPALAMVCIMKLTSGSIGSDGTDWFLAFKPLWPFRIMNGYSLSVAAASGLGLMTLIYYVVSRRILKFDFVGIWLAAGFALLYLAIPSRLFGTSFVDLRVIPAAALIIPAFCSLSFPSRRWMTAALTVVSGITVVNLATVFAVWLSYRADYGAVIQSFSKIGRDARVIVGSSNDSEDPPFRDLTQYPMYYAPTLAVVYANAFVPNLFTEIGKQPVRPSAAVSRLAIPYGGPMPIGVLSVIAAGQVPSNVPSFVRTWDRDYDYLYLLGPRIANPLPNLLEELERSDRFILYRIHHTPRPAD